MTDAKSCQTSDPAKTGANALDQAFSQVGAGAAVRLVSALLLAGSLLATTAVLVRMLDPSSYGVLAFGLAAVGLAWAFTSLGLGPALTRTVAEHVAHDDHAGSASVARAVEAWVVAGGLVGGLAIVILMVATQTQLPIDERLIIGAGLGMLLLGRNAAAAAAAFALGSGRLVLMDIPTLFANVLQFMAAAGLYIAGVTSAATVAAAFGAVGLLTAVLSLWVTWRISGRVRGQPRAYAASVSRLARVTAPYAVSGIMIQVISFFDVLILGITHPSRIVGAYEPLVLGVSRLTAFIPVLLMVAYLPAATGLFSRGHRDAYAELYRAVSKVRYVIAWPIVVLLGVAPIPLFRFIFGSSFVASPAIVRILIVGSVVDLVLGLNGQALVASGERRRVVVASIWPLVTMVVLSVLLIPPFGAVGAAAATTGAVVVLNLSMSWALYRGVGVHPFDRQTLIVILSSPVACVVPLALLPILEGSLMEAVLTVGCGWLVWIGILRLMAAIRFREVLAFVPRRTSA